MKKIKLLTSLSTIAALGIATLPLTSCSKPVVQHTLTFSCSDGVKLVGETSVKVNHGTKWKDISKPEVQVDEGYKSLGWYTTGELSEVTDDTEISQDTEVKYYALDKSKTYTKVTIKTATQTFEVPYLQGGTWGGFKQYYEITSDPTKEDSIFEGWFKGDEATALTDESKPFESTAVTIQAKFHLNFYKDTWANMCVVADKGLDYAQAYYKIDDFIGLEKAITFNGQVHAVRIIGVNHDTIASTNQTATFTFELRNLYSDSEGYALNCHYAARGEGNINYPKSILYNCLNSEQEVNDWIKESGSTGTHANKSIYTQLKELGVTPKKVTKQVATGTNYDVTNYDCYCFPLTLNEMAQKLTAHAREEGKPYAFWQSHSASNYLIRYDTAGTVSDYGLASPNVGEDAWAWLVTDNGTLSDGRGTLFPEQVAFAFCI